MKIETVTRWIPPQSTNTEPTYFESIYTVIGSMLEVDDFQEYVSKYKPNKSFNRNADKTPASG